MSTSKWKKVPGDPKLLITGKTYPVRDQIKALGCRWDADQKGWMAPTEDVAIKARALVDAQTRPTKAEVDP